MTKRRLLVYIDRYIFILNPDNTILLELQEKYKNNNAKLIDILSKDTTIEDRQTDEYISEYSGEANTEKPKSVGNRTNKTTDIYEIDDNTGEAKTRNKNHYHL